MECKDCDRNGHCGYQLDAATLMERVEGENHFIKGRDCPKDWQDKKVEDMTEEQLKEAVKELRAKLLSTTENKNTEENMARTRLFTDKEIREAIKEDRDEVKLIYKKPPLECKPSWLSSCERIEELSEAIIRNVNGVHKDTSNVKKWATEILYHCEIMEKC